MDYALVGNCLIVGTTIVVVGAGIYYLIKKARETNGYIITCKETDTIKMSDIGEWLKTLDVDMEDFGKTRRIFVVKNLDVNTPGIDLTDEIKEKLSNSTDKVVVAFVLSDMNQNTKNAVVVIGKSIEEKFEKILKKEVTEINLN